MNFNPNKLNAYPSAKTRMGNVIVCSLLAVSISSGVHPTPFFTMKNESFLPKHLTGIKNQCRLSTQWPIISSDPLCIVKKGEIPFLEVCVVSRCQSIGNLINFFIQNNVTMLLTTMLWRAKSSKLLINESRLKLFNPFIGCKYIIEIIKIIIIIYLCSI